MRNFVLNLFVMEDNRQLEHEEMNRERKTFPVAVLTDGVRLAKNIGSIFRICEAFGVSKLYIHGLDEKLPNRKFTRVARSTEKILPYGVIEDVKSFLEEVKKEFRVVAIEITGNSTKLQDYDFKTNNKCIFVVGAETTGISQEVLDLCDDFVHIDMFGRNSSMNVSQALSITLYEYTR